MSRSSICGSGFDSITECLFCLLICCFCLFYNLRDVLVVHSYRSPLLLKCTLSPVCNFSLEHNTTMVFLFAVVCSF